MTICFEPKEFIRKFCKTWNFNLKYLEKYSSLCLKLYFVFINILLKNQIILVQKFDGFKQQLNILKL